IPPCRTIVETRLDSRVHPSLIDRSPSSAVLRCCVSKSGGTYSASITGVIGSTLTSLMLPPDARAIAQARSSAGLAKAGSATSTGTRIFLYTTRPLFLLPRDEGPACHVFTAGKIEGGLIGRGRDRFGRNEALQAPGTGVKLAPALEGKIEDR